MRWDFRKRKLVARVAGHIQSRPTFSNPLFHKDQAPTHSTFDIGTRILNGVVIVLACMYVLLYSPVFTLSTIVVTGAGDSTDELITIGNQFLTGTHRGILLNRNFFTFPHSGLQKSISAVHSYERLTISRKPFRTIQIDVQVSQPELIFQSGTHRLLVDARGVLTHELSPEEVSTLVPIVEEIPLARPAVGESILTPEATGFILSTNGRFTQDFGAVITDWVLPSRGSGQLHLRTDGGWDILFTLDKDLAKQYTNALQVWNDTLRTAPPFDYIDARILDRVYYK